MDILYDIKSLIFWICIYDYYRLMYDKLFYQVDFEYFVQGMLSEVKFLIQVRMRYVVVKKKKIKNFQNMCICMYYICLLENNRYRFIY